MGFVAAGMAAAQEEDIRGPKPRIELPEAEVATPWLGYGLWGLLALAVLGGWLWWLRRRKSAVVSAEQWARAELERLEKDGVELAAGDFALGASGVVREFIERKFGLAAPRRTTEEFLHELAAGGSGAWNLRVDALRGFLRGCDMAKFAAMDLGAGERGELVAKARAFIDGPFVAAEEPKREEAA